MRNPRFSKTYDGLVQDDALARPPRGFSADTPHIETIKLRHFFGMVEIDLSRRASKDLAAEIAAHFRDLLPLMEWLRTAASYEKK